MILKSPFLYMKYFNKKFEYFPKLDIWKSKEKIFLKRNKSWSLENRKKSVKKIRRNSTSLILKPINSISEVRVSTINKKSNNKISKSKEITKIKIIKDSK